MSAPAFTPGPWITVHQPEDGGAFHIDSYAGLHIAQTIGGLVGEQANACLIAAAPDLYAALDRINVAACYASEEDTDAREAVLLHIGELAHAALAKALTVQP